MEVVERVGDVVAEEGTGRVHPGDAVQGKGGAVGYEVLAKETVQIGHRLRSGYREFGLFLPA